MSFDPSSLLRDFDAAKLEALVETMYLAADADGEFCDEERDQLAASIQQLTSDSAGPGKLSNEKLSRLLDEARAALGAEGRDKRLASVKQRLGDAPSRKAAFGLSVQVTAADGIVRTSEREFIFELALALDLDRDEAANLVKEITRG